MSYKSTQRWRYKAKIWLIELMGGKCRICNYDKYQGNLVCHHVGEKTETLSRLINSCASWDKILTEAKKCVLLCHNCHGEVHANLMVCPSININDIEERYKIIVDKIPFPKTKLCIKCGINKVNEPLKNEYCSIACYQIDSYKIVWPNNLPDLVKESNVTRVAKLLGVSGNAVKKRLKRHHTE